MFGREISRDLIAALREEGLIAAGPRSPKLGAPYAYVTTEKFLLEFGFESLRDLPDLEALKDAGLLSTGTSVGGAGGDEGEENESDGPIAPRSLELALGSATSSGCRAALNREVGRVPRFDCTQPRDDF